MKKIFISLTVIAGFALSVNAQDGSQTDKGSWLIEANTGFGGDGIAAHSANTGFGLASTGDSTIWNIGAEGGYFLADDLAIKAGLGYADFDGTTIFSYKLGAKYYVISTIPVQLDITGASIQDSTEDPLWLGLQGGYAIFLTDHISVEPGLRYNLSLNEDFSDDGIFEFRIGFALFF